MTAAKNYGPVETAKLIRKALKAAFPTVKFSVTTDRYSGGSSIRVKWTDGPTTARVDEIVGGFEGKGFDGMIDMSYSIQAWVLDGQIIGTRTMGTVGSMGSVPAHGLIPPHDDAELVAFSSSYINTDRTLSADFAAKCAAQVAHYFGEPVPDLNDHNAKCRATGEYWSTMAWQAAQNAARFAR